MTIENKTKNKFLYATSYKTQHELGSKFSLMQIYDADGNNIDDSKQVAGDKNGLSREDKLKIAKDGAGNNLQDPNLIYDSNGTPTGYRSPSSTAEVSNTLQDDYIALQAAERFLSGISSKVDEDGNVTITEQDLKNNFGYDENLISRIGTGIGLRLSNGQLQAQLSLQELQTKLQGIVGSKGQVLQGITALENTRVSEKLGLGTGENAGQTAVDAQIKHAIATVDAAIQGKLGNIEAARLTSEGQKYGARASILQGAIQGKSQIAAAQVQAQTELAKIENSHASDWNVGVQTNIANANAQNINNAQNPWQVKANSRIQQKLREYQIDLVGSKDNLGAADREALEVMHVINESQKDIIEKYQAQHGGKLPTVLVDPKTGKPVEDASIKAPKKGIAVEKEIDADAFIKLIQEQAAIDVFKKYESQIDINAVKTVNGFAYKNNNILGGVEYYLNNKNSECTSGIYHALDKKDELTTKVVERLDQGDGTYKIKVLGADGKVKDGGIVNKNQIFGKINVNNSGLTNNYYIVEEEVKDILYNSSGSKVDGIMAPFKNTIGNKKGISEEDKEKQMGVVQNSLEAIFGGDNKLWGLVSLLISGQFKMFFSAVKEVFSAGRKGFKQSSDNSLQSNNTNSNSVPQPQVQQQQTVQLSDGAKLLQKSLEDEKIIPSEANDLKNSLQTREGLLAALKELVTNAEKSKKPIDQNAVNDLGEFISTSLGLGVSGGTTLPSGSSVAPSKDIELSSDKNKQVINSLVH